MFSGSKKYRRLLYFLPGLAVLLFGMLALYASVSLESDLRRLRMEHDRYEKQHSAVFEKAGLHDYETKKITALIEKIEDKEHRLYWAVIAIGLCGFVLVILNADKLIRLAGANEEKKKTLLLLEDRLAAMEAMPDGIAMIDPEENITYLNRVMREIFSVGADSDNKNENECIGQFWTALLPEPERRKIEENAEPLLKDRRTWNTIIKTTDREEKTRHIDFTLARLDNGNMIATARDVTQKLDAEEEKRTIQSQLYQAQKMEAIGRLAGGIAHDFNNILAAINGYAEFLMEDLPPETPTHGFAENIIKAGAQARSLVDQMLAFSRHKGSEFETMDLMHPVRESLAMLKASLPKTLEVETAFDVETAPVEGNATQISQIIMNLCVNAKDAMEDEHGKIGIGLSPVDMDAQAETEWIVDDLPKPDGAPLIRIQDTAPGTTELVMGALARDRNYVCLFIEDTGSGMSRAILEHIFEPFFTTKPVGKGTGLGLSTAHGVITGHRGAMRIKSALGEGTRFELFFPVSKMAQTEAFQQENRRPEDHGVGNILLVEDDENVRDISTKMLERLGYDVEVAETGMVALEILREVPGHFDLVITDQNMPKMTGLELICQAHMELPDIPFILLSGYSEQKLQDLIKDHPAVKAVIRKPVTKRELGEKIAHVLSLYGKTKTQAA